jgi:hypothetical protein
VAAINHAFDMDEAPEAAQARFSNEIEPALYRMGFRQAEAEPGRLLFAVCCTRAAYVGVAALLSFAIAAGSATAAGRWTHCSGGFDVNGNRSRTNDTWQDIREKHTTCGTARSIVQKYVKRTHGIPNSLEGKRVHIGAWTCTLRTRYAINPYGDGECSASGGRRISFVAAG